MLGQVGKRRGKQRHAAAAIALRRKRRATRREPPKQVAEAEREELEPSGWSRPSASDRSSDVHSDGGELSGCMGEVACTGEGGAQGRVAHQIAGSFVVLVHLRSHRSNRQTVNLQQAEQARR